jgi:hypothetical protein
MPRGSRAGAFRPSAKGGTSGGGPPTGAAGGDLAGTYPNPTIGAAKVIAASMAAGAVDLSTTVATGVMAAGRMPALTGDVTTPGGSLAATIAAAAVTLAKMANLAANSIMGNNTGSPATPLALTAAQVKTLLAISAAADLTGQLAAANVPALTGDVTTPGASLATTIASHAVTNAKAAQGAAYTLKGNATSATADLTDMTVAAALAMLADTGYTAGDYGFKAMSWDPMHSQNSGTALTPAGTIFGTRIRIPYAMTLTNLYWHIVTAGGTLTTGQCFAALYQGNALLQTTADQAAAWGSTGLKQMAITSQAVTAGFVDVVFFYNGTTGPSPMRAVNTLADQNTNLTTTAIRGFTADTGRTTTMPATLAAKASNPAITAWAAVS